MATSIRSTVGSRTRSTPTKDDPKAITPSQPKGFRVVLDLGIAATEEEAEKLITCYKNPLVTDRKHFDIQPITEGA